MNLNEPNESNDPDDQLQQICHFLSIFFVLINNIDGAIIYHCKKSSLFAKKLINFKMWEIYIMPYKTLELQSQTT